MANIDEMKKRLARKRAVVRRVLATEDGAEFLQILKDEFFNTLRATTPEQMHFNLGAADVIAYIERMNKEPDDAASR